MADRVTIEGVFKDLISAQVDRVQGRLKTLGFTGDSVFKGLLKFASAEKVFQGLAVVAGTVWKEALAESPKLSKQFDQIKEKIGVLVATMAREVIPVFTAVFKFLIENWNQIRFGFSVGIAAIKDAFNGLLGAFQMLASGFFNGLALVSAALEKFGLVSQETVDGFTRTSEAFAEKAVDSFGKVGKSVDVLKAGVEGLGKEVKATYDLFGDKKKLEDAQKALDANNEAVSNKAEAQSRKSHAIIKAQQEEERQMIEEERQLKRDLISRIGDERIEILEMQGGKELELLSIKHAREREEITKHKGFNLLSESEKATAIATMDKKFSIEKTKTEQQVQTNKIEAAQVGFKGYSSLLTQAASNYKSFAKEAQYIAQIQAGINSYLAFTNALATVKPTFPLGVFVAGGILAEGLATQNKIAQQRFETGGFPQGKNATVLVNENGQEAILNARATRNLGRSTINALNAGQNVNDTQINFAAPVLNFYGNTSTDDVRSAVEQSYDDRLRELRRMIDDGNRRGILRGAF